MVMLKTAFSTNKASSAFAMRFSQGDFAVAVAVAVAVAGAGAGADTDVAAVLAGRFDNLGVLKNIDRWIRYVCTAMKN